MSDSEKIDDDTTLLLRENRERARVDLRKMLDSKSRGDRITAAEIVDATGFDDWALFGETVRRWAERRGFPLDFEKGDGWRILLPHEHVDYAERQRKRAFRAERKGLSSLISTPSVQLDERAQRRLHTALIRAQERMSLATEHHKQIATAFKTEERVPFRLVEKDKDE
ncbi:MAG: hypothetical protein H0U46_05640 [Actinobacteria bacterium]|nr:hypothetical protein [Actinomycetota bacterium]